MYICRCVTEINYKMHGATIKTVSAQQAKLSNNYKNTRLKLLKSVLNCNFSKEQSMLLRMIV